MRRFVQYSHTLFVSLLAFSGISTFAQVKRPTEKHAATLRSVRTEIERGKFTVALKYVADIPANDLAVHSEALTLRGLAAWGEALKRYRILAPALTEVDMIRRAARYLVSEKDRYAENANWLKQIDAAYSLVEPEVQRGREMARNLPRLAAELDDLLARAQLDFQAAAKLKVVSSKEWTDYPECWLLLAKVHQYLIFAERQQWSTLQLYYPKTPGDDLIVKLPAPTDKKLAELDTAIDTCIDRLIERANTYASQSQVARVIADATLLKAIGSGQLQAWARESLFARQAASPPRQSPEAKNPQDILKLSRLSDAKDILLSDPVRATIMLYYFASQRDKSEHASASLYSCYSMSLAQSPETAAWLLKTFSSQRQLESLKHLENARASCLTSQDLQTVEHIVRACSSVKIQRPVLSGAPHPIRQAFLEAAKYLLQKLGPDVGAGYDRLYRFLGDAAKSALVPTQKAQYLVLVLKLAQLMVTSDLPWDRNLAYKHAGIAVDSLKKMENVLTASQWATVAALEQRFRTGASEERFPPSVFAVVNGKALWSREPFTRIVLHNPNVAVSAMGGVILTGPPGEKPSP